MPKILYKNMIEYTHKYGSTDVHFDNGIELNIFTRDLLIPVYFIEVTSNFEAMSIISNKYDKYQYTKDNEFDSKYKDYDDKAHRLFRIPDEYLQNFYEWVSSLVIKPSDVYVSSIINELDNIDITCVRRIENHGVKVTIKEVERTDNYDRQFEVLIESKTAIHDPYNRKYHVLEPKQSTLFPVNVSGVWVYYFIHIDVDWLAYVSSLLLDIIG